MKNPPIIQLTNVSKSYEGSCAVESVSFSVERGQLLVLLGPSGCGKTTTLRLVAGLERPDSGTITLDGAQVAGDGTWVPPERRRVGMVFQDYALFPHLTIADNILFALKNSPFSDKRHRIQEMLALTGLDGLGKRFPHQLSGGQQQRVALARALAPQPSVVLLDEPFSNLDATLRKAMRNDVRRMLKEAGATTIFVTHDQEEALSIADTVAVMQGGRLLQIDTPQEIYLHPQTREVATFVGEANILRGTANGDIVDTPLGLLPLARGQQGPVEVVIRPEAITLSAEAEGNAHVVGLSFHGDHQSVDICTDDGIRLEAHIWAHIPFALGQRVRTQIAGDVVAFPTDER